MLYYILGGQSHWPQTWLAYVKDLNDGKLSEVCAKTWQRCEIPCFAMKQEVVVVDSNGALISDMGFRIWCGKNGSLAPPHKTSIKKPLQYVSPVDQGFSKS